MSKCLKEILQRNAMTKRLIITFVFGLFSSFFPLFLRRRLAHRGNSSIFNRQLKFGIKAYFVIIFPENLFSTFIFHYYGGEMHGQGRAANNISDFSISKFNNKFVACFSPGAGPFKIYPIQV